VELAVVTPILLLMIFGIMEFGMLLFDRETLINACRESCRVRVLRGSSNSDALTRFNQAIAASPRLSDAGISPSITSSGTGPNGDTVWTVTATVPRSTLSLFGLSNALQNIMGFFGSGPGTTNTNIVSTCSMREEG
jgi:Flp pilus assembly protein TadG